MEADQVAVRGAGDGANAKRKLDAPPLYSVLPRSALSPAAGNYDCDCDCDRSRDRDRDREHDATAHHPWSGADAMDSQAKVRRRGSCLAPTTASTAMKRCCSEGKIARTLGASSPDALGCPVSPSMAVLRAAQGKDGSPRQPDRCWSPSARTADSPPRQGSGQTQPELEQTTQPPPLSLPLAAQSPSIKSADSSLLPHPCWDPSASAKSPTEALWPQIPPPASPRTLPAATHDNGPPGQSKRAWPPRRSRNPGNLSLDMSQVDQGVPESVAAGNQRHDQAAVCSQLTDFLFIGGAAAAKDKDSLTQAGITHIVNCAASVAPAFYPSDFAYYNLWLRDHSTQDVARHFYAVFDFIERARKRGGRVFVHCVKGISRSPTMAIAYLMWYKGIGMYEALELVRQARPVVDPNAGFIFQLTEWEQLHLKGKIQLHRPIVFRIEIASLEGSSSSSSSASRSDGIGNGARPAERPLIIGPLLDVEEQFFHHPSGDAAALSFVVASSDYMCIWCGQSASEQQVEAAQTASELLQAYESFPARCDLLYAGRETPAFWSLLGDAAPPED